MVYPSASLHFGLQLAEVLDCRAQPFLKLHLGLPIQQLTRLRDIGLPLLGIVLRQGLEDYLRVLPHLRTDFSGQLIH